MIVIFKPVVVTFIWGLLLVVAASKKRVNRGTLRT
jgi:hypothetical protein